MDLSAEHLHRQLDLIADQGWDGPVAQQLLCDLRAHVVRPVVRASSLRGPAADQAEATGWAAAWEALRRPTARSAENPGGMIWSAVRRSIGAEVRHGLRSGTPCGGPTELDVASVRRGSEPIAEARRPGRAEGQTRTPHLDLVQDLLVAEGWDRRILAEVIQQLAERHAQRPAWRVVSIEVEIAAWQVRRLAQLVLPHRSTVSLLSLVVTHGRAAIEHPAAHWAARSTLVRWHASPEAALEQLSQALDQGSPTGSGRPLTEPRGRRFAWTGPESAEKMGGLP